MIAEQYLKRIKKIDALVTNKKSECARWKEKAEGLGGFSSSEGVQFSRNLQKSQDASDHRMDLEREIKCLERERESIIKTLEELPTLDYDLLFKFYAGDWTYKELARHFGKSYDWAKRKRKAALGKLQKLLDEKSTV